MNNPHDSFEKICRSYEKMNNTLTSMQCFKLRSSKIRGGTVISHNQVFNIFASGDNFFGIWMEVVTCALSWFHRSWFWSGPWRICWLGFAIRTPRKHKSAFGGLWGRPTFSSWWCVPFQYRDRRYGLEGCAQNISMHFEETSNSGVRHLLRLKPPIK